MKETILQTKYCFEISYGDKQHRKSKSIIRSQGSQEMFSHSQGIISLLVDIEAVDNVSFNLMPKETLGVVGESGCGKTTVGRSLQQLNQQQVKHSFRARIFSRWVAKNFVFFDETCKSSFKTLFFSQSRMTIGSMMEMRWIHGLAKGDEKFEMVRSCSLK